MDTDTRSRREQVSPRAVRLLALALAAAVVLVACGGSAKDDAGGATTTVPATTVPGATTTPGAASPAMTGEEVCALVTAAEIEKATGLKTKDPFPRPGTCTYVASEQENTIAAAIAVDLVGTDNFTRILRVPGSTKLDHLGDKALINPDFFTVGALEGETYVQVQFPTITDKKQLEKASRDFIEKIFERLKK